MKRTRTPVRHRRCAAGFTLVELLVVIGIIGLLVAMLLPSLGGVFAQAQVTECLNNMRQVGIALHTQLDHTNTLIGPNSTGLGSPLGDKDAQIPDEDTDDRTTPLQNCDWVSPLMGNDLNLPLNAADRLIQAFNIELRCPLNTTYFDSIEEGGGDTFHAYGVETMYVGSYAATLGFQAYSSLVNLGNVTNDPDKQQWVVTDERVVNIVALSTNYRPRIQQIGNASQKVFLFEGAPRIDHETGSYAVSTKLFHPNGGNFMAWGPCVAQPDWGEPAVVDEEGHITDIGRQHAWRHNGMMNVCFFDGHCETLSIGETLDVRLWFPRGSKVIDADATADPNDRDDMVIQ